MLVFNVLDVFPALRIREIGRLFKEKFGSNFIRSVAAKPIPSWNECLQIHQKRGLSDCSFLKKDSICCLLRYKCLLIYVVATLPSSSNPKNPSSYNIVISDVPPQVKMESHISCRSQGRKRKDAVDVVEEDDSKASS